MFYSCNRELRIDLAHDATVGERCRKLKFFLRFHQDPSMSSSKQRVKGESLHLHTTCRSRAEASQGDGDDGVVLERDSDHRCPSAERTAPPRSTHVRDGRRLLLLDPARGKERLMKIQQHDGVVVDAGRHSSRASPRLRGRDVTGKMEAPGAGVKSLLSPHYI